MKIVKVFKTDVENRHDAKNIILFLERKFSHYQVNFDLDDCDRMLRIETRQGSIEETKIQWLMAGYGHRCEPLQDWPSHPIKPLLTAPRPFPAP